MASLAGEPWCFAPGDLAALTDAQIELLYFADRDKDGKLVQPKGAAPDAAAGGVMPREMFVAAMLADQGGTDEFWNSEYDRVLEASRGPA